MASKDTSRQSLRTLAEERLHAASSPSRFEAHANPDQIVYELELHRVELELQNEALRDLQRDLETSRDRYRRLYELAPVPYLTMTEEGRIVEANLAAQWLLGGDSSALSGCLLSEYVEGEHATTFELHRREVWTGAGSVRVALRLSCAGSRSREVRLDSVRLGHSAQEWITSIVDLTELGDLERLLRQSQRLEALGVLAAGVAHDFNNLLHAIMGGAQIALGRLDRSDGARRPLEMIRRAAWRGRSVVRQLQAFGRADGAPQEITDLNSLISSHAPLTRRLLGEDIDLRLSLTARFSVVQMDPGTVEQVLLNLAANARRAMQEGGSLTIATAEIGDTEGGGEERSDESRFVEIRVTDTGHGMDEQTRAHALQPFFTTKGGGGGLGLSMVARVVEQARGTVSVISAPQQGTTICIRLPLFQGTTKATSETPDFESAEPLAPLGVTVLVVEDDPLASHAARGYLESMHCEVYEVGTGEEAIELLRRTETRIRVLIVDVILPGIGGAEVTRLARLVDPTIAVVLTSAHALDTLAARGHQDIVETLLRKPFTGESLHDAIRWVLRSADTVRPRSQDA